MSIISSVIIYYITSSKKDTSNRPTPSNSPTSFISPTMMNDLVDSIKNPEEYQAKLNSNPNALNNFKLFKNTTIQTPWTTNYYPDYTALVNRNTYYDNVVKAHTPVQCATRCLADSKCKGFMMGNSIADKPMRNTKWLHNHCYLTSLDPKSVKYTNSTNIDWDDTYINNNNINEYNALEEIKNKVTIMH